MPKCATSLWSADLSNLASEIKRVEPYSDRFHIDVADGDYVPTLLFFPDMVKAMRPHTNKPFEVHLMTRDPMSWIEPFAEAGADGIMFDLASTAEPGPVLEAIRSRDLEAGLVLQVHETIDLLEGYWDLLSLVTLVGTPIGIKGADMDSSIPEKIRSTKYEIQGRSLGIAVESDGGIRRHTVPLLHEAGTDFIVPGSLMFNEDPAEMRRWLDGL